MKVDLSPKRQQELAAVRQRLMDATKEEMQSGVIQPIEMLALLAHTAGVVCYLLEQDGVVSKELAAETLFQNSRVGYFAAEKQMQEQGDA